MADLAKRFPSDTPMEVETPTSGDLRYMKVDQTVPQTVINGAPHFNGGIVIKAGQKLILDGA